MTDRIVIRGAKIGFRNFEGGKDRFNPKVRNFAIFLDMDTALALAKDGWNVKFPTEEKLAEGKNPFLKVEVSYKKVPPIIVLKTGKRSQTLGENEIRQVDYADIDHVDLIVNPSHYDVNGKKGIKAYLKSIYVTVVEDEFAEEYRNVPEISPLIEEGD